MSAPERARPGREQFREAARTLTASWPLPSRRANLLTAQAQQRAEPEHQQEGDQSAA